MLQKSLQFTNYAKFYHFKLELSKRVTRPNPARPAMGWPLSGLTQPGSLISEPTKLELDLTHHGLAG